VQYIGTEVMTIRICAKVGSDVRFNLFRFLVPLFLYQKKGSDIVKKVSRVDTWLTLRVMESASTLLIFKGHSF
jgi:hypothetical protein